MLEIIGFGEADRWDAIVKSFDCHDIYYMSGYIRGFHLHGDGEPLLMYYSQEKLRGICVMMKRDIADIANLKELIQHGTYFDMITPYGYGGWLFEGDTKQDGLAKFHKEYMDVLRNSGIVSVFSRLHPLLDNAATLKQITDVIDLGNTVSMELSSDEIIDQNLTSKNRNMVRKAQKAGISIENSADKGLIPIFMEIYESAMNKDNAADYYYFGTEYYNSLFDDLTHNVRFFYATYQDQIVSMAIMLYCNGIMHYHLSGSLQEFRHLAPSNLLLYEAAKWGHRNGLHTFHLGGGLGSSEDSLYKFKKAFNRNSDNRFSISKEIINKDAYNKLVDLRSNSADGIDTASHFFPLYRA